MRDAQKAWLRARDGYFQAQGGLGALCEAAVRFHEESVAKFSLVEREQYEQLRSSGKLPLDALMLIIYGRTR